MWANLWPINCPKQCVEFGSERFRRRWIFVTPVDVFLVARKVSLPSLMGWYEGRFDGSARQSKAKPSGRVYRVLQGRQRGINQ